MAGQDPKGALSAFTGDLILANDSNLPYRTRIVRVTSTCVTGACPFHANGSGQQAIDMKVHVAEAAAVCPGLSEQHQYTHTDDLSLERDCQAHGITNTTHTETWPDLAGQAVPPGAVTWHHGESRSQLERPSVVRHMQWRPGRPRHRSPCGGGRTVGAGTMIEPWFCRSPSRPGPTGSTSRHGQRRLAHAYARGGHRPRVTTQVILMDGGNPLTVAVAALGVGATSPVLTPPY